MNVLKSPDIDRHNLSVEGAEKFIIHYDGKSFNGELRVIYQYGKNDDVAHIKSVLTTQGFSCAETDTGRCSRWLGGLSGNIHQKNPNQNNRDILMFYHPFTVGFYKEVYTTSLTKAAEKALMPVTIVADVVTLPLQLIGLAVIANESRSHNGG